MLRAGGEHISDAVSLLFPHLPPVFTVVPPPPFASRYHEQHRPIMSLWGMRFNICFRVCLGVISVISARSVLPCQPVLSRGGMDAVPDSAAGGILGVWSDSGPPLFLINHFFFQCFFIHPNTQKKQKHKKTGLQGKYIKGSHIGQNCSVLLAPVLYPIYVYFPPFMCRVIHYHTVLTGIECVFLPHPNA